MQLTIAFLFPNLLTSFSESCLVQAAHATRVLCKDAESTSIRECPFDCPTMMLLGCEFTGDVVSSYDVIGQHVDTKHGECCSVSASTEQFGRPKSSTVIRCHHKHLKSEYRTDDIQSYYIYSYNIYIYIFFLFSYIT